MAWKMFKKVNVVWKNGIKQTKIPNGKIKINRYHKLSGYIRNIEKVRSGIPPKEWNPDHGLIMKEPTRNIPKQQKNFFINDMVEILVGKDCGKVGKIFRFDSKQKKIYVTNMNKEFVPINTAENHIHYGCIERPYNESEIALYDPIKKLGCNFQWIQKENNEKVRMTSFGNMIPVPPTDEELRKLKSNVGNAGPNDTNRELVTLKTWIPSLKLFHEEIMEEYKLEIFKKPDIYFDRNIVMSKLSNHVDNIKINTLNNKESWFTKITNKITSIFPNRK